MLQARKLGKELFVGVHSDEAILENKGPTVMTLEERLVYWVAFTSFSPSHSSTPLYADIDSYIWYSVSLQ